MNKNYNLKLDLQFRCNNSIMKFNQFDNNTSDFFMRITNGGNLVDIEKALVVLAVIKPSGKVASQFVEVKNGLVYADLKPSMKDEIGNYTAQAMLILEDERVVTNVISYEVEEDKIFSLLNDTVETTEEFTLLTDMLIRLSAIEISEEQRMINEAERILSEENRKIEEAKRVEAELIRQHEEADRAKYDATRESNENIRKQNESIRLANEANRIDEETKRVEEENKRKLAEEERNANYNFMTEDEERRRLEANAHKEAEALRVSAENTRVNEEAKRRTTEQARVSAENTRVSNENIRKANEVTRQTNETKRVEAETQRQNRYNSFIADAEANTSNFENYTNTAKVKEEERKSNELDRKSQEDKRVSNEVERISNENTRKANEKAREKNETSRQYVFENKVDEVDKKIIELNTTKDNFVSNINTKVDTKISEIDNVKDNFVSSVNTKVDSKISELDSAKSDMTNTVANKVNEVENRFNALTSKQQQDAEVIDARDGEISLKARLDRDIEKTKQVYVNVEGSHISTDSSVGYLKDVEILGNTIQSASNLADIRSVGDKVEGQELYEIPVLIKGKNLFYGELESGRYYASSGDPTDSVNYVRGKNFIPVNPLLDLCINFKYKGTQKYSAHISEYDIEYKFIKDTYNTNGTYILGATTRFVRVTLYCGNIGATVPPSDVTDVQLECGTQATPYEPYIENKLTILSPVQVEKVGDVADRIIEKDGVWGVEKNVSKLKFANLKNIKVYKDKYTTSTHITSTDLDGILINRTTFGICNMLTDKHVVAVEDVGFRLYGDTYNALRLNVEKDIVDETQFKSRYADGYILYPTVQSTFIPLPHDQQIKLRTFANKTNISFLTEIEGTIKAQVPKSIGATVNTHTEQINNLNKELDRVKKLEESTVSTVTTESDFTTVEATSNGYFEDVKVEGKTLVNHLLNSENTVSSANATDKNYVGLQVGKTYTVVVYVTENNNNNKPFHPFRLTYSDNVQVSIPQSVYPKGSVITRKFELADKQIKSIWVNWCSTYESGDIITTKTLLLEGDHTQNPPSYFEGLKSVGQSATTSEDGVDEISVESVKNLLDYTKLVNKVTDGTTGVISINGNRLSLDVNNRIEVYSPHIYVKCRDTLVAVIGFDKKDGVPICDSGYLPLNTISNLSLPSEVKYITINSKIGNETPISKEALKNVFIYHQSDKKRLLYYNEETQAWEKPILREWDSIEKHANGKYYYHQRSGEVVLNGSESWSSTGNDICYGYQFSSQYENPISKVDVVCDKLLGIRDTYGGNRVGLCVVSHNSKALIRVGVSQTSVEDFKQWLQANNVTVVYQLAEEKIYECTNIDLITYANETNYIVESGAIVPRTTLKVHSNISNVVSLLQKKVSLLESNIKASQEVQDMMILETDMRMLDIELALMEFVPITLNLGGSDMLRSATYFNFLKNHIVNETYEKEYLENVMNKYLATGRINQDEYNELYKMLYPPVYDIELPIEY